MDFTDFTDLTDLTSVVPNYAKKLTISLKKG